MKDKYIIVDLNTQEFFKNFFGEVNFYDSPEEADEVCGINDLDNVWICKLVHNHTEEE